MSEVTAVLFKRKENSESDDKVRAARFQVDLAILKMEKLLDSVQKQALEAREEIHGRQAG